MQTLTLTEIHTALVGRMAEIVAQDAVILSPWQDGEANAAHILVIHALSPSGVRSLEKGGPSALAVLSGVYNITLSAPPNSAPKAALALKLSDRLLKAFYQQQIPVAQQLPVAQQYVYTEEAYPSEIVRSADNRVSYPVSVRWFAWAGAYQ